MNYQPTSLAEAKTHRYGKWAGNPKGYPFDEKTCAAHRMTGGRGSLPTQCNAKPGHGPDGIYCSAHAMEFFPEKSETWFYTDGHSWKIKPVQVFKSTEVFVWVGDSNGTHKTSIKDRYGIYWQTEESAKQYLIQRAEGLIATGKRQIEEGGRELKKLKP